MSINRFIGLAFAVAALGLPAAALAQATRTWVSGVGDDANPCSRTAPCKTFAGAISKTAAGGEIDALDPAGYGGVTITKSITLDGGGGQVASILVAGTPGITVNIPANEVVTIRNLQINGLAGTPSPGTHGIRLVQGGTLNIENCVIFGFGQHGIDVVPTTTAFVGVINSNLFQNLGGGLFVAPTGGQTVGIVDNSHFDHGLFGVKVTDNSKVTINRSVAFANANNGFSVISAGGPAEMNLDNTVSSNNGVNGVGSTGGSAIARISNTTVTDNGGLGLGTAASGQMISSGNNRVSGNVGGNGVPTSTVLPF